MILSKPTSGNASAFGQADAFSTSSSGLIPLYNNRNKNTNLFVSTPTHNGSSNSLDSSGSADNSGDPGGSDNIHINAKKNLVESKTNQHFIHHSLSNDKPKKINHNLVKKE